MKILVGEEDGFNIKLAEMLDIDLIPLTSKTYKDGEVCPRIHANKKSIERKKLLLCLRKTPDENPNDYLNRFLFTAGALKKEAANILAVMPYLVYARQDKDFLKGGNEFEPISIEIMLESLGTYVHGLLTFNSHFEREQKVITKYAVPIHNLDAFNVFGKKLREIKDLVIIAPDKGMKPLAEKIARKHECEFDYLEKSRNADNGEIVFADKDFKIEGKNVVTLDDMISTGGTMIKGIKHLKKYNPANIYAMAVHGAFTPGAYEQLKAVCTDVFFTDTLKSDKSKVSVVEYLAAYIRKTEPLGIGL